jgi:hypothetical protein
MNQHIIPRSIDRLIRPTQATGVAAEHLQMRKIVLVQRIEQPLDSSGSTLAPLSTQ